jgi:acetylornithine deacetylase/succinyl-diaminopimelate desuccinylase-like protein
MSLLGGIMSRENALKTAEDFFDSGQLFDLLQRRVAYRSESQNEASTPQALAYLNQALTPYLEGLGFACRLLDNPEVPRLPILYAERIEDRALPTVLTYGHGDTVLGMEDRWRPGLDPWTLTVEGERWYGRGAADNKGQHTINFAALNLVLRERGRLGFNVKALIEIGEEMGSPGLRAACAAHKKLLASDVLIASDGPRLTPSRPTIFGGSRGVANFDLRLKLREGGHHSGNWGGLLSNPGIILAHALACLVDQRGKILVPELRPAAIPASVTHALAELDVTGEGGPEIDPNWGEPGLSAAEKVFGWNTLEVLAFKCGNPEAPAHAIPPEAWARLHIRFTVDSDPATFAAALRRRLDSSGFPQIEVIPLHGGYFTATRLDPDNPWARFAIGSLQKTSGKKPAVLPNLGGSLPNDAFTDILGLPTIWVPHSYGGCSQHAPNEHALAPVMRDALLLMTGLFYDLAEQGAP